MDRLLLRALFGWALCLSLACSSAGDEVGGPPGGSGGSGSGSTPDGGTGGAGGGTPSSGGAGPSTGGASGAGGGTASSGGAGPATGGASGAGGTGGAGGSGGAAVRCTSYPGITGCLCSQGSQGSTQECSKQSAAGTDQGYCCKGDFLCSCYRIACVSLPNIKSCDCGIPLDTSGDRVTACPRPTGGVCCLRESLGSGLARCKCSGYATKCDLGDREVQSCTLADIMMCPRMEGVPVDRCN